MVRKLSAFALVAALAAPMVWADRAERVERSRAEKARVTTRAPITDEARALVRNIARGKASAPNSSRVANPSADQQRSALTQAPGVTQINLFDSAHEAYFVVTETIPTGSTLQAFVILPDRKQEWGLESLRVTGDLQPGYSLKLPHIGDRGDFWQEGLTRYAVVVTDPNGNMTTSLTDFATGGAYRDATDTQEMVPGINSWREFINGDGDTIVEIKGRFITDIRTYVVFEDIVAPQDAIWVMDRSTIQVNVSRVPNFDITRMTTYLLTIGQDSWTDLFPFRHTPR